jgi:DNA-binding IscR family transcriptional regulator
MDAEMIALHVLRALAESQLAGERMDLETLAEQVRVRRRDLRAAVSSLHRAGLVDALRMRVSLRGFALGAALARAPLAPLRRPRVAIAAA